MDLWITSPDYVKLRRVSFPASDMTGGAKRDRPENHSRHFQMPLHYPRYSRSEYGIMPEWKLDNLLTQYGLPATGDVETKRNFAMGAFLWPR
ncbi:hypothetical protein RJ640_019010 [Escallonia rubra]|uniref:DUF7722 domain-containing protein n=1 Tax=Escallonia rubra TaxID=112253 RepID=A0AA88U2Q3_9ASTE|nr:hypothetical protein RJ640_019010 [Escallonia rubra]